METSDTTRRDPVSGGIAVTRRATILETGLIAGRLRRPYDLVAAAAWALTSTVSLLIGLFAGHTSSGVQADIATVGSKLPAFLVVTLNFATGAGLLLLPILASIDLLIRKRARQCADSLVGLGLTMSLAAGAGWLIERHGSPSLRLALAGALHPELGHATTPLLAATVTFATVARLAGRPGWRGLGVALITTSSLTAALAGGITVTGVVVSVTTAASLGYLLRWMLGITSTRPRGQEIVDALAKQGHAVQELRASSSTQRGREYIATTAQGALDILVFDRDLEGGDLLRNIRHGFRVRGAASPGVTVRRSIDRATLMAHALERAGVPTRRLMAACSISEESALIAYERRNGTSLDAWRPIDSLQGIDVANQLWHILATAHAAGLALRDVAPSAFAVSDDGRLWLRSGASGSVAADDVQQRIDLAMALVTAASLTDAQTAVESARVHMGEARVIAALPALQRFAMSESMSPVLRAHHGILSELRQAAADAAPAEPIPDVRIERVRPRALATVVLGTAAGYLLAAQLSQVSAGNLWQGFDNKWLAAAAAGSIVTYAAMTMIMIGHMPARVSAWRSFLTQWAASVANLMTPSSLGTVAMNIRFYTRAGIPAPLAVASVGLSQATGVVVHVLMLVTAAAITGTRREVAFAVPAPVGLLIVAVVLVAAAVLSVPRIRAGAMARVRPFIRQVVPQLVAMARNPRKIALAIGGQLLINSAYIVTLYASVRAAGGQCSVTAAALVYLAGATIGQAVPTPGGLGGIEALLTASLSTAGLPLDQAVVSTLVFRLVTFWLPLIPGWLALRFLTNRRAL